MKLENRKTLLLMHLYNRINTEMDSLTDWIAELDAIEDIVDNNKAGMREWEVNKEGKLFFK